MIDMKRLMLAASAAFFFASSALAQNSGTVTSRAFAVGKGPGQTGFTSVLCTQAQIAIGQNAANPICAALSGDITMTAGGVTAIGANKVTNSMLATAADGTIKSNISGGTAVPSDNGISAVLDKLLGTTRGSVLYRGASAWSALGPGTSGNFLRTSGAGADPTWAAAPGSGTVTSAQVSAGGGISVSGTCTITTTGNCTVALANNGAVLNANPSNPSGLTNTTQQMYGLGVSTCRITPVFSTRLRFTIQGRSINSSNGTGNFAIRYGTGAGPANAATASSSGTAAMGSITIALNANSTGFHWYGVATGLTAGVAVWFDLAGNASTGTTNVQDLTCIAEEF